uniref:Uncharacterized protein n=1 Tax=Populus trichocarpa TaxID=3694 RepID=A0A3N7FRB4_POPTR
MFQLKSDSQPTSKKGKCIDWFVLLPTVFRDTLQFCRPKVWMKMTCQKSMTKPFLTKKPWLGAVKAFEEFRLSIYGDNDDEESAIGNGKANDAAKKKKNQLLKMQLRSLQTTTGQILLIMDMILVFHLCIEQ